MLNEAKTSRPRPRPMQDYKVEVKARPIIIMKSSK